MAVAAAVCSFKIHSSASCSNLERQNSSTQLSLQDLNWHRSLSTTWVIGIWNVSSSCCKSLSKTILKRSEQIAISVKKECLLSQMSQHPYWVNGKTSQHICPYWVNGTFSHAYMQNKGRRLLKPVRRQQKKNATTSWRSAYSYSCSTW